MVKEHTKLKTTGLLHDTAPQIIYDILILNI